jgi:Phage integrase, N-terminal SAM-like domain
VTHLKKLMLEELERRNYAASTTRAYLRAVEEYARYFNRPPDQLGPDHIRQYQAYLFRERKLQPNTVIQHLGGIRFFYIRTLKQSWSADLTPYPKKAIHLPSILSREEVSQKHKAPHDPARQRVPSPVPPACAPAGIRPHPPLRADGASVPGRIAPALPETAGGVRQNAQRSSARRKCRFISSTNVELSTLRRPDGSDPTTHRHRDSLPLSASSGRATPMTRSFSSPSAVMPKSHRHTCVQIVGFVKSALAKVRWTNPDSMPRTYPSHPTRALNLLSGIQNP